MQFDSLEQELRCRLLCRVAPNYSQYKLLAEWLDCYLYIYPDNRTRFNFLFCFLDSYLTLSDQRKLWKLILELEISHTPAD